MSEIINTYRYRTFRKNINVNVESKSMTSGSQALQYVLCTPRWIVVNMDDVYKRDTSRVKGDIKYMVNDLDGVLEAWVRATSIVSFMEIMVNKQEEREKGARMSVNLTQDGVK